MTLLILLHVGVVGLSLHLRFEKTGLAISKNSPSRFYSPGALEKLEAYVVLPVVPAVALLSILTCIIYAQLIFNEVQRANFTCFSGTIIFMRVFRTACLLVKSAPTAVALGFGPTQRVLMR